MSALIAEGRNVVGKLLASGRRDKPLWTRQSLPRYRRNRGCWFQGFDISGLSVWNSQAGVRKAGTLIGESGQWMIFAGHYPIATGDTVRCVDVTGEPHERTVVETKHHPCYRRPPLVCDIQVARLSRPMPSRVRPLPILPDSLLRGMPAINAERVNLDGLPLFATDQEEKMILLEGTFMSTYDMGRWHQSLTGRYTSEVWFSTPYSIGGEALKVTEPIITGDSGSPVMAIWQGRLCLVMVLTSGANGTSIPAEFDTLCEMGVDLNWG